MKWDRENRTREKELIEKGDSARIQHFYAVMLPAYFSDSSFWIWLSRPERGCYSHETWLDIYEFFEVKGRQLFDTAEPTVAMIRAKICWYEKVASGLSLLGSHEKAVSLIQQGVSFVDANKHDDDKAEMRLCAAKVFSKAQRYREALRFCKEGITLTISDDSMYADLFGGDTLAKLEEVHFEIMQSHPDCRISDDDKILSLIASRRHENSHVYKG